MRIIYFDGQYLNVNPQFIEAMTPGVFKAQGVFETMLGLDGLVFDADLHMRRLRKGLKALGIEYPSINQKVLNEVLRRNHLNCARVRMMVWQAGQEKHVMIAALPYKVSNNKIYRVCLIKTNRRANTHFADVKSLDYGLFANSFAQAQSQGFDEALLLNSNNHIFEASRANIFWIKDKILYTPPLSSGCLKGITRGQVITEARHLKILVKEKNLTPAILEETDGAFLCNSLIGIKPIVTTSISNLSTD